jgi:hypothetical protein
MDPTQVTQSTLGRCDDCEYADTIRLGGEDYLLLALIALLAGGLVFLAFLVRRRGEALDRFLDRLEGPGGDEESP